MFTIEMLPARHGDCLWIEYGTRDNPRRVLIDGGPPQTAEILRQRIEAIPEDRRAFELLVITHVDEDHLGGLLEILADPPAGLAFRDIWFNAWKHLRDIPPHGGRLGAVQGEMLSALLERRRLPWNRAFDGQRIAVDDEGRLPQRPLEGGLTLTLLTPSLGALRRFRRQWERETIKAGLTAGSVEEAIARMEKRRIVRPGVLGAGIEPDRLARAPFTPDRSLANGSSIALLAEFEGTRCLLAGDAHAGALLTALQRLGEQEDERRPAIDAFKLAHHGGKHNTSVDLIGAVRCRRFLFSTSGDRFKHPDLESVARVITTTEPGGSLCFNYRSERNRRWDDFTLKRRYRYTAAYPSEGAAGLNVSLAS